MSNDVQNRTSFCEVESGLIPSSPRTSEDSDLMKSTEEGTNGFESPVINEMHSAIVRYRSPRLRDIAQVIYLQFTTESLPLMEPPIPCNLL
jgi:hypothetical protein